MHTDMCVITYHYLIILRPKRPKILTNAKDICVFVSMTVQERISLKTDSNHIKTSTRQEKSNMVKPGISQVKGKLKEILQVC